MRARLFCYVSCHPLCKLSSATNLTEEMHFRRKYVCIRNPLQSTHATTFVFLPQTATGCPTPPGQIFHMPTVSESFASLMKYLYIVRRFCRRCLITEKRRRRTAEVTLHRGSYVISRTTRVGRMGALILFLLVELSLPSDGQIARPTAHTGLSPGLHVSGHIGVSAYGGDLDNVLHGDETGTHYLGGELIWQPSLHVSAGLGLRNGSFPMLTSFGRDRRRLRINTILFRVHPLGRRISPYAILGGHRTTGGSEPAMGPVGGMGVSWSLSRSIHLFGETTLMFVTPDHGVDAVNADASFDRLGFASFGVRIANPGVPYANPVELSGIENPRTVEQGKEAVFTAQIEPHASLPVVFIWEFAPDVVLYGPTIRRTFSTPGLHDVQLIAWNAGGSDLRETDILVLPDPNRQAAAAENNNVTQSGIADNKDTGVRQPTVKRPALEPIDKLLAAIPQTTEPSRVREWIEKEKEPPPPQLLDPRSDPAYVWVLASTLDSAYAAALAERWSDVGPDVRVLKMEAMGQTRYRVVAGRYTTSREAINDKRSSFAAEMPEDAWLLLVEREDLVAITPLQVAGTSAQGRPQPAGRSGTEDQRHVARDTPAEQDEPKAIADRADRGDPGPEAPTVETTPDPAVSSNLEESNESEQPVSGNSPAQDEQTADDPQAAPGAALDEPKVPAPSDNPTTGLHEDQTENGQNDDAYYTWVVASFKTAAKALELTKTYRKMGFDVLMMAVQPENRASTQFRVTIGRYNTMDDAERKKREDVPRDAPSSSWLLKVDQMPR